MVKSDAREKLSAVPRERKTFQLFSRQKVRLYRVRFLGVAHLICLPNTVSLHLFSFYVSFLISFTLPFFIEGLSSSFALFISTSKRAPVPVFTFYFKIKLSRIK